VRGTSRPQGKEFNRTWAEVVCTRKSCHHLVRNRDKRLVYRDRRGGRVQDEKWKGNLRRSSRTEPGRGKK